MPPAGLSPGAFIKVKPSKNAGSCRACTCSDMVGTELSYTLPSGEVVKYSEAMLRKQAVVISELFKIEDGRIRRIEAVMAGGLPLDAASGW